MNTTASTNSDGTSGFVFGTLLGIGVGLVATYIISKRVLKDVLYEWSNAQGPPKTEHLDVAERALTE